MAKQALTNPVEQRRQPTQERSRRRRQQILDTTVQLLEEVGMDDLTTILIAKRLQISVGSLYHYFPNKQAILYALVAHWLDEMTGALEELEALDLENLTVQAFVEQVVERMQIVYVQQRALLPLMQALWTVPELRELDAAHDEMYVSRMAGMLDRVLGSKQSHDLGESARQARVWLHLSHGVLMVVIRQDPEPAARTLADLKRMGAELFDPRPTAA